MKTIKSGIIKRLHVNQHVIRENLKTGDDQPVCSAQTSRGVVRGRKIHIIDSAGNVVATLLQAMDAPLGCGARVYIDTQAEIRVES